MIVVGLWLAITTVGVIVVVWNQREARTVRDVLTKGGELHREARFELQRHRSVLAVLLLHLLAGVGAMASRVVESWWAAAVPIVLIVAEFVLVAASVRERRR